MNKDLVQVCVWCTYQRKDGANATIERDVVILRRTQNFVYTEKATAGVTCSTDICFGMYAIPRDFSPSGIKHIA